MQIADYDAAYMQFAVSGVISKTACGRRVPHGTWHRDLFGSRGFRYCLGYIRSSVSSVSDMPLRLLTSAFSRIGFNEMVSAGC